MLLPQGVSHKRLGAAYRPSNLLWWWKPVAGTHLPHTLPSLACYVTIFTTWNSINHKSPPRQRVQLEWTAVSTYFIWPSPLLLGPQHQSVGALTHRLRLTWIILQYLSTIADIPKIVMSLLSTSDCPAESWKMGTKALTAGLYLVSKATQPL